MLLFKRISFFIFTFLFISIMTISFSVYPVYAKKIVAYSYDEVYKALPKKYRTEDYIYNNNGIGYIKFAKYDDNAYRMSVKKSSSASDYIYCVDYSKHIELDTNYAAKNNLFNDELRSRIGIALMYGTTKWGKQADGDFTTGNSILDYYMTQAVIHSIIYKYGGNKSHYGIDYSSLTFDSNTATLKKKTKSFYDFCCKTKITLKKGNIQNTDFAFKNKSYTLYASKTDLSTDLIECTTNTNNASVESFERKITTKTIPKEQILIKNDGGSYNSSCNISVPLDALDKLSAGKYTFSMTETVNFTPYIAGFWNCKDSDLSETNQEVGSLIMDSAKVSDDVSFNLLIGEVSLKKTDAISNENINSACFSLQQFDDAKGEYVNYKELKYNAKTGLYESGNIYINRTNSKAKFKIIEVAAGPNYINDWKGATFQLTDSTYSFRFNVQNSPVLGSLDLEKTGANPDFQDKRFVSTKKVALEGIQFALYAAEDIKLKDKVLYKKDQKIIDLKTDSKGMAHADDLCEGKYYLQETKTQDTYLLNSDKHFFEITRDQNHKFSNYKLELENNLKECEISLYKYSQSDSATKLPLQGAKFGLYAKNDIMDTTGKCIIPQNTLIEEGISNEAGIIQFRNLIYADYYLKELVAPNGYIINDDIIDVLKSDFKKETNNHYIAEKECLNQEKRYQIKILKQGECIQSGENLSSEYGNYVKYNTANRSLKNIKFSLYDEKDNLLQSGITQEEGYLTFQNLLAGNYYILEDEASPEYILDHKKYEFTIKEDDYNHYFEDEHNEDHSLVVESPEGSMIQPIIEKNIMNELFSTNITIHKLGEKAEVHKKQLCFDDIPLKGIVFGIYQNFDYTLENQKIIPKNSCVGYIVTDQTGLGVFSEKIPVGEYYLKEVKTNSNYIIDDKLYYFNVTTNQNKDYTVKFENNNIFHNNLAKASVKINKYDSDSKKPIKGVEFTLYNEKDDSIGVYKTNRKGNIVVENLPYGKYYFIETKCKNGYYSTNNKYHFTLDSDQIVTLNISNQPVLQLGYNEHYKIGLFILLGIILFFVVIYYYPRKKVLNNAKKK